MSHLLERLGLDRPIVQAGMGGGVSRHELAAAVSDAGGLGTIGTLAPARLRSEIHAVRSVTDGPLAVNLLLPFVTRAHWEVAESADVVVTFWGVPRRRTPRVWLHQCGSVAEARTAHGAGADGVIVQGVEAGGHVRGDVPALDLLEHVRATLPSGFPLLLAGGLAESGDVAEALAAGADAAVLGTRFLLSEESHAHEGYKRVALGSTETVLTELFGLGWPAPHRVLPNAACRRWLRGDRRGPAAVRATHRALSPVLRHCPPGVQQRLAGAQRVEMPLLSPTPPLDDAPAGRLLDAGALYAGESVARIADVRPARALVADLTP